MEEVKAVEIDGIDYIIDDEIIIDGVRYMYLTNSKEIADFLIKKVNIINGKEMLVSLNDKQEFDKAIAEFVKKNNNLDN